MFTGLSLKEFKSRVTDLARPNRFEVEIYTPSIYNPQLYSSEYNLLHWLVQNATIPSRSQGEINLPFHGMELKLPGDYSKENISLTFLNSYGWEGRRFFERWMDLHMQTVSDLNDRRDALSIINDSYLKIKQMGRTASSVLATYKLFDVFPTNISEIQLDMNSTDQVETFVVTFAYSYWDTE